MLLTHARTLQGDDVLSAANTVVGLIYEKRSALIYYISLDKMNDSLLNENVRLHKALASLTAKDTVFDLHSKLPTILASDTGSTASKAANKDTTSKHTLEYAEYEYKTAMVINNSTNNVNNYITINRGSNSGIAKGMSVITGTGLVGWVEHVSAHYATVLSIMSKQQVVSARLKDGTYGFSYWDNENPTQFVMKDMPQQIKVKPGDSVFTTSYSRLFPPDILLGTVIKSVFNKHNGYYQLYLKPSVNFRNLQYVYVVQNKMIPERKQLEDSSAKK